MADIDVVKKSSHTWLWILLALVVVLALWFLMSRQSGERASLEGGQPFAAAPVSNASVETGG